MCELPVDLVVAFKIEFVKRVEFMCPFAGIDEKDTFGVIDGEDPDGLPVGRKAAGDLTGGEEMELYRCAICRELDGCGGEHAARYRVSDSGRIETGQ